MRFPKSVRAVALALMVGVTVIGATACAPQDDTPVDISAPLPTTIPAGTKLVIADQQNAVQVMLRSSGLDKNLPYKLEFANFTGGPAILEAFRANTADAAPVGDVPPISAQFADQQVPIILARETKPTSLVLATSPRAGIRSLADLRGKKIGYAEGTAQQVIVLRALANAGLTTDDVELVRLQLAEFSEALGANEIDAAPLNEPRLTRYLRDHGSQGASFIPAAASGKIYEGLNYVYARGQSLTDPARAAALRHFVGVLVQAYEWANTNTDKWIDSYYVKDQNVTAADGRRILESQGSYAIPRLDDALIARQQGTIDVLDKFDQLPKKVRAVDSFDRRFAPVIEEAVAKAGIERTPGEVTR